MARENQTDLLFFEPYAAAQSLKNYWTRLASTYGCIRVSLTSETLSIKPHGFANWLIWPLGLDLSHDIPVADIQSVRDGGVWFSYGKVEVRFRADQGEQRAILLYLKNHAEFRQRVNDLLPPRALPGSEPRVRA